MAIRKQTVLKKGQTGFTTWLFIIVILLTFSIFFLVLRKSWSEIQTPLNEGLTNAMPSDTSVNVTEILDQTAGISTTFDLLFPFIIIGLFGFVMIGAGAYLGHPIMIFVGIIMMAVLVMLGAVYANVYDSISSSDEFSDAKSFLGIQDKFMQYLPYIVVFMIIGIAVAVIMAKGGGSSL